MACQEVLKNEFGPHLDVLVLIQIQTLPWSM